MYRKLLFILVLMFSACGVPHHTPAAHTAAAGNKVAPSKDYYYTCDMHPQIHSDRPGNCPICGMPLVKVMVSTGHIATGNFIKLSPAQQLIAGIRSDTIGAGRVENSMLLEGNTETDPLLRQVVSTRVSGRIDQLFARNPGEFIRKGEPLYDIYSQDLLSAEQDYITVLQQPFRSSDLQGSMDAVRTGLVRKLMLWGLTPGQIRELQLTRKISGEVRVYSNQSGILRSRLKQVGEYVQEGDGVLELDQLDQIWVHARLYAGEARALAGKKAVFRVSISGIPDTLSGIQVFDDPEVLEGGRFNQVTLSVQNKSGQIRPGMMTTILVTQHSGERGLVIPESAVMDMQGKSMVWIREPGGIFVMRKVRTGTSGSGEILISQGLIPGDVVVVSGAYMLNSEFSLKYGSMSRMHMAM